MKRANIEIVLGWLDALRRDDRDAATAVLADTVVWQGLREDIVCSGPQDVVEGFIKGRDEGLDVDSLELIGRPRHVVLGLRVPQLREVAGLSVNGEFYNVFTLSEGAVTRIDDYRERSVALAAAGVDSDTGTQLGDG